ncbi:hypothetical protein HFD88_005682 [Aspergillus terreus]|nr:hypothetical protein HFD88_005682 [Aspergillus terreus]
MTIMRALMPNENNSEISAVRNLVVRKQQQGGAGVAFLDHRLSQKNRRIGTALTGTARSTCTRKPSRHKAFCVAIDGDPATCSAKAYRPELDQTFVYYEDYDPSYPAPVVFRWEGCAFDDSSDAFNDVVEAFTAMLRFSNSRKEEVNNFGIAEFVKMANEFPTVTILRAVYAWEQAINWSVLTTIEGDCPTVPLIKNIRARCIAIEQGFKVMGGSMTVAARLGRADIAFASLNYFAQNSQMVANIISRIPLIANADMGFESPWNIARMVQIYDSCVVAGFYIRDQVSNERCGYLKGKEVVDIETWKSRMRTRVIGRDTIY